MARVDVDGIYTARATAKVARDATAGTRDPQDTRRLIDFKESLVDLRILEQHVVNEEVSEETLKRLIRNSHEAPLHVNTMSNV
jgi:hypothetical protein